ncbi:hypothetical protein [Paraburkholderia terrae]|uniref:hypothetical protein n=1 Tax=Paraburkholderia terrae TaxID=311230 RepID=UPI001E322EEF|nr:hypothetical protein [Paraburkholderia terrae]
MVDGLLFAGFRLRQSDSQLKPPPPSIARLNSPVHQIRAYLLKSAGCTHTLLADSGLELLRQASRGLPRHAGRILRTAMQLAVPRGLNHLPDELLQQAIEEFR